MLVVAVVVGHVSGESFVITRCVRASSGGETNGATPRRRRATGRARQHDHRNESGDFKTNDSFQLFVSATYVDNRQTYFAVLHTPCPSFVLT